MSTATTEVLCFDCAGARLVGLLERPARPRARGVVIVVGGPQYRVGSHRQFVHLARSLALRGFPVLRFDYRGMGDSDGRFRGFEHAGPDIAAAVEAFRGAMPEVRDVVLWGLCDGASAAAFHAAHGADIAGLVLANPWVRTEQGLARSYVSHYYGRRLLDPAFWRRLLGGGMNPLAAARDVFRDLARARAAPAPDDGAALPERLRAACVSFGGPMLFLLSGEDLTAREFADGLDHPDWRKVMARPAVKRVNFPGADHTFSRRAQKEESARACAEWLESW